MNKLNLSKNLITMLGVMVAIFIALQTFGPSLPTFNAFNVADANIQWPELNVSLQKMKETAIEVLAFR